MKLHIIKIFFFFLVISTFSFSVEKPKTIKMNSISIEHMPDVTLMPRDSSGIIRKWRAVNKFDSEYYKVSSDSLQVANDVGQLNGYKSSEGITISSQMDTALLNFVYIDSGVTNFVSYNYNMDMQPSRSLLMSNTPITKSDRINSVSFFGNTQMSYSELLEIYEGDTYPRYLYTSSLFQLAFFMSVTTIPVQTLHVWIDENTVEYYNFNFFTDYDPMLTFNSFHDGIVNFDQKTAQFDSLLISLIEYPSNDTVDFILDGNFEPDSIIIPSDSLVLALDHYNLQPSPIINQWADNVTWVFNDDQSGYQIDTYINNNWGGVYPSRDSTYFTWEIIADSVQFFIEDQDSFSMQYGLLLDSLYFVGENIFCEQGLCPDSIIIPQFFGITPDTFDIAWFENLTGLSSVDYSGYDIGLKFISIDNDAQLYINPNAMTTFETYSVGSTIHTYQIYNIGLDTLEWNIEQPDESWISMEVLSGTIAPDESDTITFIIEGESLASDTQYPLDLFIHSNENDEMTTIVPITIQVNPPDLYMVGLSNSNFTIDEDDSLEAFFYVIGPEGNTTFSISGDTSSISGYVVIDESYIPNSISNYTMRATLNLIPEHNWYGEATVYVTADNEYDYSNTDTLSITVNSVYDQILEPEMVFPPNGHTFYFESFTDSVTLIWSSAGYPDYEAGPGFEYRLRIVQSNETGNIDYNYTDITDTTFTFFPDSSTYAGQNNNYIWSLYTTEENLPEVLDGQGGVFHVILPQMDISLSDIPNNFRLYNAYPNPFNPTTMIQYDLPEDSFVSINIYNMIGRHVRTMLNKRITAGQRSIIWDGTNSSGQPVSAGTYFFTIKTDQFSSTKKMIMLK